VLVTAAVIGIATDWFSKRDDVTELVAAVARMEESLGKIEDTLDAERLLAEDARSRLAVLTATQQRLVADVMRIDEKLDSHAEHHRSPGGGGVANPFAPVGGPDSGGGARSERQMRPLEDLLSDIEIERTQLVTQVEESERAVAVVAAIPRRPMHVILNDNLIASQAELGAEVASGRAMLASLPDARELRQTQDRARLWSLVATLRGTSDGLRARVRGAERAATLLSQLNRSASTL